MSAGIALQHSRSAGRQPRLALDPVIVITTLMLLLAGLIMVASASLTIGERQSGDPFFHFERQLFSMLAGLLLAVGMLAVPIALWQRGAPLLLGGSFLLLLVVLIPGLGHEVNGSRRWIRIGVLNFQPSELARWMLPGYVAVYAVRHEAELRASTAGFLKPLAVLGSGAAAAAGAGLRRAGRAQHHWCRDPVRGRGPAARRGTGARGRCGQRAVLALSSGYGCSA